ncbi:hypothetical protein EX30DRAFT_180163 [Ascodesmis nigricans]|uniref:Lipocalin-like domain-containing protein n=1 Tax=Ascodesmis nigricans TaxID=341454 RepID=A0A4S2ML66_9PEZI|nr:hypothetical protein EX30DRAFT_180163 [Ascodesmis nigricans]
MSPAATSPVEQFRNALIGAWELISYRCEPVQPGDETVYPMTRNATGIIMYTPDGYMSAQLMTPGTPKFADGDLSGGTTEELVSVAKNYLAYSGPFKVTEENGKPVLRHSMEVASFPNWLGNTQVRVAELEEDRLVLQPEAPIVTLGVLRQPILEWRRKKSTA